ncbi:MAG: hypothetical protein ACI87E_001251 [Mariniblastus sp.]|jgi:hypothetical protein
MNLRANTESKFLLKYLLIGIGCLAFAVWSLYDGLYGYPSKIPRAEAWAELKAEVEADELLTRTNLNSMWKAKSKEMGWSSKSLGVDDTAEAIRGKIIYQWVFVAIGLAIGLPCTIWYLTSKNTWIESTADGLRASNGNELKISQITKFDKKKWERKGIGVLHFSADDGSQKTFVVDDLKYEREPADKIVRWVESQIPSEMIVNGEPESIDGETVVDSQATETQESESDHA